MNTGVILQMPLFIGVLECLSKKQIYFRIHVHAKLILHVHEKNHFYIKKIFDSEQVLKKKISDPILSLETDFFFA